MNHYLKNITAKNLHLTQVIQPRLASRFEPISNYALPVPGGLWISASQAGVLQDASDQLDQGREELNHFIAPDSQARAADRNKASSSPAFTAGSPDSSGFGQVVETESTGAARLQSRHSRSKPLISERKKPFSTSNPGEGGKPDGLETDRSIRSAPAGAESWRSSKPRSFGLAGFPEAVSPTGGASKGTERNGLEYRNPLEVPLPRNPVTPAEKGANSPKQKTDLKLRPADPSASRIRQQEVGAVHIASIRENSEEGGAKYDRLNAIEPIADIRQSMPPISPAMVAAQARVERYSRTKRNETAEKPAKPETEATVQVTIGRIEIRASPVAAIPQRRRTEPQVMSLEDYLKIKRGSL